MKKNKDIRISLTDLGFVFGSKGEVREFNGNIFADYLIKQNDLLYSIDGFYYYYLDGVYRQISDTEIKRTLMMQMNNVAPDMWKPAYERLYMESLKYKVFYGGPMNAEKAYVNLKNGMLHLNTRNLVSHSQEYHSTVQLPFSYDPKATCPLFQQFLHDVFENDEERIRLAQEWLGYLLTCETRAQMALILYGSGGNGKSVFSTVIENLIGRQNISFASITDLSNQFIRATLFDKQLVMSLENEIGSLNTQYFKQIVGGDTCITASHKGQKPFEFFPICKIVMSTNNLPDTRDRSEGFYRRLSFLHFSKHFSENERDVNLSDKLKDELPGILNFALDGLERLRENEYRFSDCKSSVSLLAEYRTEQNPFLEFANECLLIGNPKMKEENRIVYSSFKNWCGLNGHRNFSNVSSKKFWRELDHAIILLGETPPVRKNSGNCRYCYGLSVKNEYRY